MFTDIVGYTALMGSDEDKAFDMLKRNHTIHATLIRKHNGKLIKEVGDGTLASFPLASDAVRCAMDIQNEAKRQNIPLKIGIHQGEMVMVGADVLGDGVNVASRLQESAEEGCISISGAVYRDVKNKAGITAEYLEDKTFKNVDDPVKVYQVKCEEPGTKPSKEDTSKTSKSKLPFYIIGILVVVIIGFFIWQFLPSQDPATIIEENETVIDKSIAVLPFRNDSPDQENEYFCNGTVEAILTNIQKIEDLRVKSRTSSEQYRNPDKDLTVIASELKVAYILEGSVQKIGDNIRITAQLIHGITGDHLWAENYDGKYTEEVLTFQSDVAKKIASSLQAVITPKEEEQIDSKPTENMGAYDLHLKGQEMLRKFRYTGDTTLANIAINLFNQSRELDPENEGALSSIPSVYIEKGSYDTAMYYAERTIELFPEYWAGYQAKGRILMLTDQLDSAYKYIKKGYDKNPNGCWVNLLLGQYYNTFENNAIKALPFYQRAYESGGEEVPEINSNLGWIYWKMGYYPLAEQYVKQALQLRSECLYIYWLSRIYMFQGKSDVAIHFLDSICSITPCEQRCLLERFYLYTARKELDQAEKYCDQFLQVGGNPGVDDSVVLAYMYKEQNKEKEANEILNKVRNSIESKRFQDRQYNFYWTAWQSATYAVLDEKEESLKYMSEVFEIYKWYSWADFITYHPIFKNLRDDPGFKAIIKRNREKLEKLQAQINEMREKGEISF
jgi:TolB-like protein/Tfp pilus assembly protein PilF